MARLFSRCLQFSVREAKETRCAFEVRGWMKRVSWQNYGHGDGWDEL